MFDFMQCCKQIYKHQGDQDCGTTSQATDCNIQDALFSMPLPANVPAKPVVMTLLAWTPVIHMGKLGRVLESWL